MSHNTLKINSNSFGVDSNITVSVASLEYAYYACESGFYTSAEYPFSPSAGQNFLFSRVGGIQDNNISSGFTEVNNAGGYPNFIEKLKFTANGTYKLSSNVGVNTAYHSTSTNTHGCGVAFYNETTGTQISNAYYHVKNSLNYSWRHKVSTIYEHTTGSTPTYIVLRILFMGNPTISNGDINLYQSCNILVEKLQ